MIYLSLKNFKRETDLSIECTRIVEDKVGNKMHPLREHQYETKNRKFGFQI